MDKKALFSYATWAKVNLEEQIEVSLKTLGINSENDIKTARIVGDYTIIDGDPNSYPADYKNKRDHIIRIVKTDGYKQVIEEFAYTWFNRIVALRFMEVHDFLPHGFRVLSSRDGGFEPEVLKNVAFIKNDLKIDVELVNNLKSQGKIDEAYRYVLFRQCKALSGVLPMLFDEDSDYLELLLPKALLKGETIITKLMEIGEEDFLNDVEVMGWLYQFYISQKKDAVFASKQTITKDTLPAVTQLFTPDWIVRYMAENSVGRIWMESYPNSALKSEMKYFVEDEKYETEVQRQIDVIKYKNLNPEDIRIIEPCCGSGHILVYVFDLLYKMYEEHGYQSREIPTLILKNNLVGLDVDKRAAQLAAFSLVMKARKLNSRFFSPNYYVSPKVVEIWDSRALRSYNYESTLEELKLLTKEEIKNIKWLVETFRYGKTIGSLIKVEKKDIASIKQSIKKIEDNAVLTIFNSIFLTEGIKCLYHLIKQAEVMSAKYDVMITNPPYIGTSSMEDPVKDYANTYYPNSKTDMAAMFMETEFTKKNGFVAMINPESWMSLISYVNLREKLLQKSFPVILDLGERAFDCGFGTVSFVMRNCFEVPTITFIDLTSFMDVDLKEEHFRDSDLYYVVKKAYFHDMPNNIFGYHFSNAALANFRSKKVSDYGETKKGILTGKDEWFVRYWYEVLKSKVCFNGSDFSDSRNYKWFPVTSGGEKRKWYGNLEYVVDLENYGANIKRRSKNYRLRDSEFYFREAITWSEVGGKKFAVRYVPKNILFGNGGPVCFGNNPRSNLLLLGLLNSVVGKMYLSTLAPTINFGPDQIKLVPVVESDICDLVEENISIAKADWDSTELSWDFVKSPLLTGRSIRDAFDAWNEITSQRFNKVKHNEEIINQIFIEAYGLTDELSAELSEQDVTVRKADKSRDIKNLISYLVGVEMGRYSLDVDGLVFAGGEWNSMNYVTYQPDNDGIIPVYSQLGMQDGLTARIIRLVKHIYGEETYRENIDFIAEALGKNTNESSEETLNRYLNDDFYQDHLQMYKSRTSGSRPIYWMFSSGKNDAFKCLIYLHRYNEDTLARINSKYFLNESARINAEVEDVRIQLETAEGRDKLRLDKLYKVLIARQKEMIEYGQVLDHMANQYINLDLDDGVKVNYTKFQGIEIVNDNGAKVKKDLLVPIK